MKKTKLIAKAIPIIPEYIELLSTLREKYDIPEVESTDEGLFTELRVGYKWDLVAGRV